MIKVLILLSEIIERGYGMALSKPKQPVKATEIKEVLAYFKVELADEMPIKDIISVDQKLQNEDLTRIDIRKSTFDNCDFSGCQFNKGCFVDIVFKNCDFSNAHFSEAFFERCAFYDCKSVGTRMTDVIIKQTAFIQTNFKYADFDKAQLSNVLFEHSDLSEASITEAKLKSVEVKTSKFIKTNFFKTALANIDFSDSEFKHPVVSNPPTELVGIMVNMFQAAELIGIWGVVVKP
jgi:uncharacterized protein YjbI with pentapeptide repeats